MFDEFCWFFVDNLFFYIVDVDAVPPLFIAIINLYNFSLDLLPQSFVLFPPTSAYVFPFFTIYLISWVAFDALSIVSTLNFHLVFVINGSHRFRLTLQLLPTLKVQIFYLKLFLISFEFILN